MRSEVPATAGEVDNATEPDVVTLADADLQIVREVLTGEYSVLMSALSAAWSASLTRTSIFLFTLSSAGVALGFAAQAGVTEAPFRTLALVVLPIVLFLGVATFVRLVQLQRESIVYITGINRIRRFLVEVAPGSAPYLVLPTYDDDDALYRSFGTGMQRQRPRRSALALVVQTQGVVGVITGAVAAAFVALASIPIGTVAASIAAAAAFVMVVAVLFVYWQRSLAELGRAIRSLYPTPSDQVGRPF
jgi:hypothetical protein